MRKTTSLFALAVILAIPTIVQAITITNQSTNTVVFSDNFESAPSVATGLAPDATYHNPVAQIGSYNFIEDVPALVVTNSTASPDPGPYQGNNYLRIYRDGGAYANQEFAAIPTSPQTTNGNNIRISMMVNSAATAGNMFGGLYDPSGNVLGFILAGQVNPGVVNVYNGAWQAHSVPYIPGKWQRWDIDYSVGAGGVTVTVDGNSASAGILSGGAFGTFRFWNGNGNPGQLYIDAVPEPSTIVLLASTMFGLLGCARRKRK